MDPKTCRFEGSTKWSITCYFVGLGVTGKGLGLWIQTPTVLRAHFSALGVRVKGFG